ncbi:MAG: hypothetical protein K2G26_01990 [Clostridia bacterium]|nr:hypothetical protein [Clostridia bacterium]
MKNKKILTMICSVATAATLGITALAGCNKEKHAYTWTVDTEETCSAPGHRTGVCGICGYVKEEEIKIDPSKHGYGDWQITMPTEQAEGKAVKICEHNNAHTAEVTLPRLTADGTGYVSHDITKEPTAISEGVRTYVLETENGPVEVNVTLPKKPVTTVEDAVLVGSNSGHLVRSASGTYSDSDSATSKTNKFSVEFGDNYTHVTDEGQKEQYWFSTDDRGEPFGVFVRVNRVLVGDNADGDTDVELPDGYNPDYEGEFEEVLSDPRVVENVTASHLLGFGYSTGTNNIRGYGAEDLLAKYYEAAQTARANGTAVHYEENFLKAQNGEITADFSYSFYENPNFARYSIEFTLYASGAIKTLRMDTKLIRAYMIAEDSNRNKLFYEDGDMIYAEEYDRDPATNDDLYEMQNGKPVISGVKEDADGNELHDANGNTIPRYKPLGRNNRKYYSDDHSEVNNKTLIYNEQVLKTDSDVVPENPYKSDVLYIGSFDVKYDGNVIGESGVELPTNQAVYLEIDNVLPTTATLDYDPLRLYVRTETRDIELTNTFSDNPYSMIGSFLSDATVDGKKVKNVIVINSRYATKSDDDYVTLVLKTYGGRCEKLVKLKFEKGAPSSIKAQAYTYSDVGGQPVYRWTDYSSENHAKIYVGQTLYLRAVTANDEAGFADTSFTASLFLDNSITFVNGFDLNGEKVTKAVASKAGSYQILLQYNKTSSGTGEGVSFAYLYLDVEEAPDLSEVFNGQYTAEASLKIGDAVVPKTDMNVTFSYTGDWHQGEIAITSEAGDCVYNYVVDADNKITVIHKSGITATDNGTFNFSFALNEAYKLEVTHYTGLRDIQETIVLSRPLSD